MTFAGYIGSKVRSEQLMYSDSFLGGSLVTFPSFSPPSDDKISCKGCGFVMNFLMQIYCPLGESSYHRILYIFVCLRPICQFMATNWRVLRSQYPCNQSDGLEVCTSTNWSSAYYDSDESDNDWGVDVADSKPSTENSFEELRGSILSGPFESFYIDVYDNVENGSHSDSSECNDSNFESWFRCDAIEREFIEDDDNAMKEAFDSTLQSYLTNRGEFGCEIVRYCWSGKPLFNGPPPIELKPALLCSRCGSKRVFELQLFPTLNNSLKLQNEQLKDTLLQLSDNIHQVDLNWLLQITTVLLFTCSNSCWNPVNSDQWVEECIVIQTDKNKTQINYS